MRKQLKRLENEFAEWRKHTVCLRRQLGIPVGAKPWSSHASGIPEAARATDVVDSGWWKIRKAYPGPTVEQLKVDIFAIYSRAMCS